MTKVISFSSGKGGVGKTVLTANLGWLWAKRGRRVLLVDADWSLGKLSLLFKRRPQWTVEAVLKGEIELKNAVEAVTPGLSLLASPSGVLGMEEIGAEERKHLFFQFEGLQKQHDLILLDHSSGVNWGVLDFAAAAHQHVIVTTPEPTALTDAYAIMKILSRRFAIRDFVLVVSMCLEIRSAEAIISRFIDVTTTHLQVRLNPLEFILFEPKMVESIQRQLPFVDLFPNSAFRIGLDRICQKIEKAEIRRVSGLNFFPSEINTGESLCQA